MKNKTAVLIHEEVIARKMLEHLLERSGYTVKGFEAGLPALHHLQGNEVDVIVMDLLLPDLDGLGLIKTLAERKLAPIVAVGAEPIPKIKNPLEQALVAGAQHYLPQPLQVQDLLDILEKIERTSGSGYK